MQSQSTGEKTTLTNALYGQLLERLVKSHVEVEELTDGEGNRTARIPHSVYLAEMHRLEARKVQQARARAKRRAKNKAASLSRARNRR